MDQIETLQLPPAIGVRDVARALWRRLWLAALIMSVSLAAAAYLSHHTPKRWKANAQLILIQRNATIVNTTQAGYTAPIVESIETQLALLQNYAMAQRTVDWLKNDALAKGRSTDTVAVTAEDLQKSISASSPKDTNLIDVSIDAGSQEGAADLANAVCEAFVKWKRDVAQRNVQDTMNSLQTRAERARGQLLDAERQETDFKLKHKMADVPAQSQAAVSQYLGQDAQVASMKQDLIMQEAKLNAVRAQLQDANGKIKNGMEVRDDAQVLSLQTQLKQLEMDRADLALKYTPDYPHILPDMDARIQDVKDRLAKAIHGTLDDKKPSLQAQGALFEEYMQTQTALVFNRAKFDALVAQRDRLKGRLAGMPQADMEYARLTRSTETARSMYSSLQAALSSMRIDRDIAGSNVQIAQPAFVPDKPFQPNLARDLLTGGVIGLLLSMSGILLLEQTDRRIRNAEQVRRLVPGPIIGTLPRMSRSETRGLLNGQTPLQVTEAYSLARANLSLAARQTGQGEEWRHQVILITSALPGEGKSVTAAELARSMARAGNHVVLIDADMRRHTQNELFNSADTTGLADVLAGRATLEDALVASETENLSLLFSGVAERNPTELVSQPQMGETLAALQQEADFVIVDAPACTVVADALFLAPYADCILHVVGAGLVDEQTTRDTTAALNAASPKTMVFFVNRTPRERTHAYRYYYGYANKVNGHRHRHADAGSRGEVTGNVEPMSAAARDDRFAGKVVLTGKRVEPMTEARDERSPDDTGGLQ